MLLVLIVATVITCCTWRAVDVRHAGRPAATVVVNGDVPQPAIVFQTQTAHSTTPGTFDVYCMLENRSAQPVTVFNIQAIAYQICTSSESFISPIDLPDSGLTPFNSLSPTQPRHEVSTLETQENLLINGPSDADFVRVAAELSMLRRNLLRTRSLTARHPSNNKTLLLSGNVLVSMNAASLARTTTALLSQINNILDHDSRAQNQGALTPSSDNLIWNSTLERRALFYEAQNALSEGNVPIPQFLSNEMMDTDRIGVDADRERGNYIAAASSGNSAEKQLEATASNSVFGSTSELNLQCRRDITLSKFSMPDTDVSIPLNANEDLPVHLHIQPPPTVDEVVRKGLSFNQQVFSIIVAYSRKGADRPNYVSSDDVFFVDPNREQTDAFRDQRSIQISALLTDGQRDYIQSVLEMNRCLSADELQTDGPFLEVYVDRPETADPLPLSELGYVCSSWGSEVYSPWEVAISKSRRAMATK